MVLGLRSPFVIYKQLKGLSFLLEADRQTGGLSHVESWLFGPSIDHTYLVCFLRCPPFPQESLFILQLLISLPYFFNLQLLLIGLSNQSTLFKALEFFLHSLIPSDGTLGWQ